jgi:small subunit ribosomal protein S18
MRRQKKADPFAESRIRFVDYKDDRLLSRYNTETGKILPSPLSGSTARHQRQLAKAIKKARFLALIPYTKGSGA